MARIIKKAVRDPETLRMIEAPVLRCDCGARVPLWDFTNTCDCGADYNFAGQRLAPRSQWGEETGEPWYECY